MTTELTRTITRRLPREQLVVRITPEGIYTREPRKRTWWGPIAWSAVDWGAKKIQIQAAQEAKAARRKSSRRLSSRGR